MKNNHNYQHNHNHKENKEQKFIQCIYFDINNFYFIWNEGVLYRIHNILKIQNIPLDKNYIQNHAENHLENHLENYTENHTEVYTENYWEKIKSIIEDIENLDILHENIINCTQEALIYYNILYKIQKDVENINFMHESINNIAKIAYDMLHKYDKTLDKNPDRNPDKNPDDEDQIIESIKIYSELTDEYFNKYKLKNETFYSITDIISNKLLDLKIEVININNLYFKDKYLEGDLNSKNTKEHSSKNLLKDLNISNKEDLEESHEKSYAKIEFLLYRKESLEDLYNFDFPTLSGYEIKLSKVIIKAKGKLLNIILKAKDIESKIFESLEESELLFLANHYMNDDNKKIINHIYALEEAEEEALDNCDLSNIVANNSLSDSGYNTESEITSFSNLDKSSNFNNKNDSCGDTSLAKYFEELLNEELLKNDSFHYINFDCEGA